jgi:hypothetical protein
MKLCERKGNKEKAPANWAECPAQSAYLCEDCGAIGDSSMKCPGCAAGIHLTLSGVINPNEKREESNLFRFPGVAA